MRNLVLCIIAVASVLQSSPVLADAPASQPETIRSVSVNGVKMSVPAALADVRRGVETVDELVAGGVITGKQAEEARSLLLAKATKIAGHQVKLEELMTYDVVRMTIEVAPVKLTALQRFAGLITFTNILWVLAIILGVVCFVILFGHWMRKLLVVILNVPPQVYEVLLGLVGLGLVVGAVWLKPGVKEYIAFTGCLLFGGALTIAVHTHKLRKYVDALSLALMAVAGVSAVLHSSQLNGFLAVAAMMNALGFSFMVTPLCYCIGFRDDSSLGRATAAGFIVLAIFVGLQIGGVGNARLMAFAPGALFLGSFVGYLGLLVASSKWYTNRANYVLFQVITVAAGVAALAVGSIWNITELQRVGGTFFILYIIEKFLEIPARGVIAWAVKGLILSGVIFAICMIVKTYSEALRPYLLF